MTAAAKKNSPFFRSQQNDPTGKMKRKTASERQRNLEKLFGEPHRFKLKQTGVFSSLYWAFRRFHYWLCFYDTDVEIDIEDLLTNPFNTQPPSLDDLQKLTGFRRDWIILKIFICANGRMSSTQWRQIFRLIFKGAVDYEFADRIFLAIAGNRSQKLITFEDLIFLLYDLIQSFRSAQEPCISNSQHSIPTTTTANFAFAMMKPNEEGKVDEPAFLCYAKCVFNLSTSIGTNTSSGDAATFGMLQHMGSSQGSSQHTNESHRFSSSKQQQQQKEIVPWMENVAKQQFKALDSDGDGLITLSDIQALFAQRSTMAYMEPLVLHTESELMLELTLDSKN
ncbi:hypothetical protein Ddc_09481 [Ditylenchus destructor]|nr:hypothetical protein Ddc_09481 [Ditylenchus destructor]